MKQLPFYYSLLLAAVLSTTIAHAKVWRVNNTPGISADFNNINTAASTAAEGDTLYVEGSATNYGNLNQTKRLVLIGPGYFLSGAGANTGLQVGANAATVTIGIDSLASGSQYLGMSGQISPSRGADDISIIRCNVGIGTFSSATYANWKVSQCYLGSVNMIYPVVNWELTNNIFSNILGLSTGQNCLVRNNVFTNNINVNSTYFANNIILGNGSLIGTNSSVKYNIATGANTLPAGNNNQNGVAQSALITGTGSADGFYQLKAGSPAVSAGEPLNGITPDAGAFGTAAPYRLSGIPPIPSIYTLTVPSSIPSNATSINVTLSTRSNN